MKKIYTSVDFLLASLCFTNLWIIIFTSLLLYFNFYNPPVLKEHFYRPAAAWPEPFEMPLYLVLTFIFCVFIFILYKRRALFTLFSALTTPVKIIILVFQAVLFFTLLGTYPMGGELYPFELRPNPNLYFFFLSAYLLFIIFITIEFFILKKVFGKRRFFTYILYLLVLLLIALLTFEPRFPVSFHEYGYFFGPIWEVIKGKTLFIDIHTDYGFYSTLFFAALYKAGLFQFNQLPIYVWLAFIIQYFFSFYLIYKISKSLPLALFGIFSIITVNYFSFFVLPITITQYSAMRRFGSVLLLFLLYKSKVADSPKLLFIFSLFCFWIVDTGIAMIMALCLTYFYSYALKNYDLKRFFKSLVYLFASILGVFILINIFHLLFGYRPINPLEILNSLRQHAGSGLTMLPIEQKSYFWVVMLIYFASLIYFFQNGLQSRKGSSPHSTKNYEGQAALTPWPAEASAKGENELIDRIHFENSILLLSANLSLTNALYFVGRSHDANLFDISILVLLNLFILLGLFWKSRSSVKLKYAFAFIIFISLIVYPAYQRRFHLTEFILGKYNRLLSGDIFKSEMENTLQQNLKDDALLIKRRIKEDEVLILSREDTFLLILSNKKNLLNVNPQSAIDTVSEMEFATAKAGKLCPMLMAADCELFGKCPKYESLSSKSLFMAPHILKKVEIDCNVKYKPIECTNQLCIAESFK